MTLEELNRYLQDHDLGAADLDDIVHDAASEMASNVNNSGLDAQVGFLIHSAGWSIEEILAAVKEAQL